MEKTKPTKRIWDITEFEYKREISKRFLYPFYPLNKCTGGAECGALNILFSKTNQGKSELMMTFIVHWIRCGEKVCAMLGEHTMKKAQGLLYKKASMYNAETWGKVELKTKDGKPTGISERFISPQDEFKAIQLFKEHLYLYDNRCGLKLDEIFEAFDEGYEKGCRIFVVDNQMMIQLETNNELLEQTDNTERLRQWANSHKEQVLIFLVSHARKIETGRIRLTEFDIAGSSNIANKATTIISIIRINTLNPNTKEFKEYEKLMEINDIHLYDHEKHEFLVDAVLEVVKEKNGKGVGFVPLKWYESTKNFREIYTKKDKEDEENETAATLYLPPKQTPTNYEDISANYEEIFGDDEEMPFK